MTPQEFFDEFGTLAASDQGVPKLRELILQLAVQGKLVPQDPNDEPAGELLSHVEEAKTKQEQNGSTRKRKAVPELSPYDIAYDAPPGWTWIQFEKIADLGGGVAKGRKIDSKKTASFPYLRVANVQMGYLDLTVMKDIEIPLDELEKYRLERDDLLLTEGGDWDKLGRTAIWEAQIETCLHQNHVFRGRLYVPESVHPRWVRLVMNSGVGRDYFARASKQTTNLASINMTQLRSCPIPVPPTAEQGRILAKVNELMGLCDRLAAAQERRRGVRVNLNRASLDRLTSASQKSEVSAAWQRVCDHFEVLYDTPETLPDLRQTILQLAVQGKLVPQDPNDEPAEERYQEICTWHKHRFNDAEQGGRGRSSKYKEPAKPDAESLPGLPHAWCSVTVEQIADPTTPITYGILKPGPFVADGIPMVRIMDIRNGTIAASNLHRVSQELSDKYNRTIVKGGEVLISLVGTIGVTAYVSAELAGANLHRNLGVITPGPFAEAHYLLTCLESPTVKEQIREATTGGNQPLFNLGDLKKTVIPLPGLSEQKRIVSKVTHLLSQVTRLESTLTRRESTRTGLLTAAIHAMLNGSKHQANRTVITAPRKHEGQEPTTRSSTDDRDADPQPASDIDKASPTGPRHAMDSTKVMPLIRRIFRTYPQMTADGLALELYEHLSVDQADQRALAEIDAQIAVAVRHGILKRDENDIYEIANRTIGNYSNEDLIVVATAARIDGLPDGTTAHINATARLLGYARTTKAIRQRIEDSMETQAITDDELIQKFFRIDHTGTATVVAVCEIGWEGPHSPVSTWKAAGRLAADASEDEVTAKIRDLLGDERFFQICPECGERNPVGWMMDEYCQSCGERNHDVVF